MENYTLRMVTNRVLYIARAKNIQNLIKRALKDKVDMYGVNLAGYDLSGLKLRNEFFIQANFQDTDLQGADFSGCWLRSSDFRGANLKGCNFTGCDLSGCDFTNTNLSEAITTDAELGGAYISK